MWQCCAFQILVWKSASLLVTLPIRQEWLFVLSPYNLHRWTPRFPWNAWLDTWLESRLCFRIGIWDGWGSFRVALQSITDKWGILRMVGGPSKIGQQGGGWGINQGCGGQNMVITGPCYPLVRLNIRGAAYIRAFKGPGSPRVPKSRSFSRWGKRPPCYRVRHLFASLEFRNFHHLPWLFKERRFKRRQILVNGSPGIILGAWQVIWTFIVMFFNFEKQ